MSVLQAPRPDGMLLAHLAQGKLKLMIDETTPKHDFGDLDPATQIRLRNAFESALRRIPLIEPNSVRMEINRSPMTDVAVSVGKAKAGLLTIRLNADAIREAAQQGGSPTSTSTEDVVASARRGTLFRPRKARRVSTGRTGPISLEEQITAAVAYLHFAELKAMSPTYNPLDDVMRALSAFTGSKVDAATFENSAARKFVADNLGAHATTGFLAGDWIWPVAIATETHHPGTVPMATKLAALEDTFAERAKEHQDEHLLRRWRTYPLNQPEVRNWLKEHALGTYAAAGALQQIMGKELFQKLRLEALGTADPVRDEVLAKDNQGRVMLPDWRPANELTHVGDFAVPGPVRAADPAGATNPYGMPNAPATPKATGPVF